MIGDDIQVTVLRLNSGQVKLGISAPPGVRILRTEVWRRCNTEKRPPTEREQRSA